MGPNKTTGNMKLSEELTNFFVEKESLPVVDGEVASIKLTCGEQRYITEAIADLENKVIELEKLTDGMKVYITMALRDIEEHEVVGKKQEVVK